MKWSHISRISSAALLPAILLSACAGQLAFREGKQLLEQGKVEAGLVELERAVKANPGDTEYRTYYFRQRENQVNQLLTNADALRAAGRYDDAQVLYRRVLAIDAASDRALAGVVAAGSARKHAALMEEAETLFQKGEVEAAQSRLRTIMVESPRHAMARDLLRRIDEQAASEGEMSATLKSSLKMPLSLEFRDTNLKGVFEVISRTANINFVLDKDVRPDLKTSIFVKNAAIEDILEFILVTNQLEKKFLSENSLLIYPSTPAKTKEYQELVVRSFYLANADVKQTVNMIKTLVKTKDIFVDEKLNMLVMRDTPQVIRVVEKLIAMQDLAEPEVTLAVEVLEISSGRLSELGIRYPSQVSVGLFGASGSPGQLTLDEFKNASSDLVRMVLPDPLLIANLRAQDGGSNLLANPRIRVSNRDKAKIHIGDRVPVITSTSTSTGFVAESVNYLDVGLKLDVEPNIFLDNEVMIKVGLEVSNIVSEITSKSGTLTYRVGTRNASTSLRLKDGETQMLAGLISNEERNSMDKVPGLGDMPLLGRLFSNNKGTRNKTEIVLLITPYIVRNIDRPTATSAQFSSGTENAIGAQPLRLKPVAKNIEPVLPVMPVAAPVTAPAAAPAPVAAPVAPVAPPAEAPVALPAGVQVTPIENPPRLLPPAPLPPAPPATSR